ncbi:MAG: phosphate ABC transporter substrate-binding protein, PhoT family [Sphingobacteriales bacterium]|nr:MAG: phosphate ABC transporter substrate-binding protein, PhoT family [Sphingobacteriales bacterium]
MRNKSIFSALLICSCVLFFSCNETDKNGKKLDTPTSGNISIAVDESVKPLCDLQLSTFHSLYKRAQINALYLPEGDAIKLFMNDSVKVVIATRELTEEETAYFKQKKTPVHATKIAYDAVAIIANNQNADSTLSLAQLGDIMQGKITTWNQVNPKFSKDKIQVVFDNSQSSTLNYMLKRFDVKGDLPANFSAVKTNPEVITYIESNKNALGIIGVSYISDRKDSMSNDFLERIKVVAISPPDSALDADQPYYRPYQAHIKQRYYPLVREVFIISREPRTGLGTGFVSFVAGNKGQMIVRLSGLLPATMPVRLVNIKKKL